MDVMLEATRGKFKGKHLRCAMMDARRMEVYTKMVDERNNPVWETQPKILDTETFESYQETVCIFGNGMPKFRDIATQSNLEFIDGIVPDAVNMGRIAYDRFTAERFEDVAYFEPNYLKEWRTTTPKKKLV